MIDYLDFVQINGTQYVNAVRFSPVVVPADRVGRQLGTVRCRLADSDAGPDYQPQDGDAAFLAVGTPVYALTDRPVTEAVTAYTDGRYALYVVVPPVPGPATPATSPDATTLPR